MEKGSNQSAFDPKTLGIVAVVAGGGYLLWKQLKGSSLNPEPPPDQGFVIKIANPPAGADQWVFNLGGLTFEYRDYMPYEPLKAGESWTFTPLVPLGTQLSIFVGNSTDIMLARYNIPIEDAHSYVFNCATAQLIPNPPAVGFNLFLKNAPANLFRWIASLSIAPEGSGFIMPYDGWQYTYDPLETKTLWVTLVGTSMQEISTTTGLGPVLNGKNYYFNCTTKKLEG